MPRALDSRLRKPGLLLCKQGRFIYSSVLQFTLNMNEYLMLDSGGCLCLDCFRASTAQWLDSSRRC